MPKLIIDGKEIEVPKGTKVIEAAKQVGSDVPFYCYHPGLSIAGNCRMCLVEIEKTPKLQIACHTECADGMVVKTQTEKVLQTRKHVLEFLLVNHPLDCPICDQAGECWLQDYYLNHGAYDSRVNEDKVKKHKAQPIGPHVILDAERCILCTRCVRFCDEVTKTQELGVINRGDHSEITLFPGRQLENLYSGNVVDICPVGALTDRDFRFKLRVWYLESSESLCNGCSRGCNIHIQTRNDRPHHARGERVMRLKPRYNESVNQWWMCDAGRYGYKFHDQNRITAPLVRKAGKVQEGHWESVIPEVAGLMSAAGKKVGVLLSPQMSNEELYVAGKLFRDSLKLKDIHLVKPNKDGMQDDFLIRADKNPNSKGAELAGFRYDDKSLDEFFTACSRGEFDGLIVFGQDIVTLHGGHLAEVFSKLKWSVFIGSNHNIMSEYAGYVLPSATYAEKDGTFVNFEGRVQRFSRAVEPLGEARPEWRILTQLAAELGQAFHYELAGEIFSELALREGPFKGIGWETLKGGGSDIGKFSAPMIPQYTQDSGLIFHKEILQQSDKGTLRDTEKVKA